MTETAVTRFTKRDVANLKNTGVGRDEQEGLCPYCHDKKPLIFDQNITGKKGDYVRVYISGHQLISLTKLHGAKSVQVKDIAACPVCKRDLTEKPRKQNDGMTDEQVNNVIDYFEYCTRAMVVAPKREKWAKALRKMPFDKASRLVNRVIRQMPKDHKDPCIYLDMALERGK